MSATGPFLDWKLLLPSRDLAPLSDAFPPIHSPKTILVTGAGGSIGAALVQAVAADSPQLLLLLDHSEQNLYEIESVLSSLSSAPNFHAVLGDIADQDLVSSLFEEHRPSLVYHAAAFKHVPLMEANPFAAIRNNALATWHLARLAAKHKIPQLLLVSTDKAANPRSIMGASKRLAELAVLRWNSLGIKNRAVRLGNVLGSHGSVVRLFLRQIAQGKNLTVTHRDVSRFFLTMDETVRLIFQVASLSSEGGLFLPDMGEPIQIHLLATRLLELVATRGQHGGAIEFTGLRPGDKLAEDLLSSTESLEPTLQPGIHRIIGTPAPADSLDAAFDSIAIHIQTRDLPALLDSLQEMVPEYKPSAELRQRATLPLTNLSSHA
jgi:FlaA1/EpsC-like NDP-sugar epimerase